MHRSTTYHIESLCLAAALCGAMGSLVGCQLPQETAAGLDADGRPTGQPQEAAYDPAIAFLKLSEIKPAPELAEPAETEQTEIPPQAVRNMTAAEELLRDGRFTEAMFELEKALKFAPKSFEIHQRMAIVSRQAGNDGRALSHITRAAEIRPNSVVCHYLLGRFRDGEGRSQDAVNEYRLALASGQGDQADPYRLLTHFYLGTALEQQGYLSAAIDQLETFLRLSGSKPAGQWDNEELAELIRAEGDNVPQKVAAVYERLGQISKAADALQAAVESQPDNKELLATYGRLLSRAGKHEPAIAIAKRLVRLDPSAGASIDLLTKIYAAAGRREGAVQVLDDLRAARPDDADLAMALFDVLVKLNRSKQAEAVLRDLIVRKPKTVDIRIKLATFYLEQKHWTEAALAVADAMMVDGDASDLTNSLIQKMASNPQALRAVTKASGPLLAERKEDYALPYVLGRMATEDKDLTRAQQMYQLALERKAGFNPALIALAEVHLQRFDWSGAIRVVKDATSGGMENAGFLRILARAYDGLDDEEQAAANYAEAIRVDPQDVDSMVALAKLYERTGQRNKAQLQYQNILATSPGRGEAREALIRLHLTSRQANIKAAARLLADFEKFGSGTPAYARSVQLVRYWQKMAGRKPGSQDDRAILADYTKSLIKISEQFSDDTASMYAVASNLFSSRRFKEARQWCEKLRAKDPTHLEARELLVYINWRLMNYADAKTELDGLLAERPNRVSWRRALASHYLIEQQFDRAVDVYEALVASKGEDFTQGGDHVRWLDALQLAGRSDEAIKLINGWFEKAPKKPEFRQWKLLLLYWAGKTDEAVTISTQWYEEDQANMRIRRQLIQAILLAEDPARARMYLLDWLDKDPDNNMLHTMLLDALVAENKFDQAVELASNGAELEARRFDYLEQLAGIYLAAGAYDDLVRVRQQIARERKSDNAAVKHIDAWQVGRALILAGRYHVAAEDFSRRIEEAHEDVFKIEWLRLLSHCYLKNKRPRLAEKQLRDVYDLNPMDEGINNDLGYTLADDGVDLQQAEKYIRFAVGARPTEAAYLDSLGWVRYKQGDFKGAAQWLTKAVRGRSIVQAVQRGSFALNRLVQSLDDPVLYDHLGDALWRSGEKKAAAEAWANAVSFFERAMRRHAERDDYDMLENVRNKLKTLKENKEPAVAKLGEKAAT